MGGRTNVQGDAEFVNKAEAHCVIFFTRQSRTWDCRLLSTGLDPQPASV